MTAGVAAPKCTATERAPEGTRRRRGGGVRLRSPWPWSPTPQSSRRRGLASRRARSGRGEDRPCGRPATMQRERPEHDDQTDHRHPPFAPAARHRGRRPHHRRHDARPVSRRAGPRAETRRAERSSFHGNFHGRRRPPREPKLPSRSVASHGNAVGSMSTGCRHRRFLQWDPSTGWSAGSCPPTLEVMVNRTGSMLNG